MPLSRKKPTPSTYIYISIIILIVISLVIARVNHFQEHQNIIQQEAHITASPIIHYKAIDMNESHWKTYTLSTLGLELKLPPQITNLTKQVKETVDTPKTGNVVYTGSAYRAIWQYKEMVLFEVSADSFDHSAGRSAFFSDLSGYSKDANTYSTKYHSGTEYRILSIPRSSIVGETINAYGLHILRVKYSDSIDNGISSNPLNIGKNIEGALINTSDTMYPGITVQINISASITPQVFDQILSTFRLTKKVKN